MASGLLLCLLWSSQLPLSSALSHPFSCPCHACFHDCFLQSIPAGCSLPFSIILVASRLFHLELPVFKWQTKSLSSFTAVISLGGKNHFLWWQWVYWKLGSDVNTNEEHKPGVSVVLQLLHVLLWSLLPVPSMVKMFTVSRGWPSLLSCGCMELLDSPTLWGSHSSSPDKDLFSGLSLLVSQFHWFLSCYSHFLAGSLPNHCPTNLPFLSFLAV